MATNQKTLESLEKINEAIKILVQEQKILSQHLAQQKRQVAWGKEGTYKPYLRKKE